MKRRTFFSTLLAPLASFPVIGKMLEQKPAPEFDIPEMAKEPHVIYGERAVVTSGYAVTGDGFYEVSVPPEMLIDGDSTLSVEIIGHDNGARLFTFRKF